MDEDKKQIIKESNYTYRDALEVSAYLIEVGKFERFYKEMQIHDLQKELDEIEFAEKVNCQLIECRGFFKDALRILDKKLGLYSRNAMRIADNRKNTMILHLKL